MGACDLGPMLVIYPEGVFYQKITPENASRIVEEHILKGRVVEDLLYRGDAGDLRETSGGTALFTEQVRIATRNLGVIDPLSIDEYIARDGYFALHKVLLKLVETM